MWSPENKSFCLFGISLIYLQREQGETSVSKDKPKLWIWMRNQENLTASHTTHLKPVKVGRVVFPFSNASCSSRTKLLKSGWRGVTELFSVLQMVRRTGNKPESEAWRRCQCPCELSWLNYILLTPPCIILLLFERKFLWDLVKVKLAFQKQIGTTPAHHSRAETQPGSVWHKPDFTVPNTGVSVYYFTGE